MVKNESFDFVVQEIKLGRMVDMQIKKENGVYILYLVKCNNSVKEITIVEELNRSDTMRGTVSKLIRRLISRKDVKHLSATGFNDDKTYFNYVSNYLKEFGYNVDIIPCEGTVLISISIKQSLKKIDSLVNKILNNKTVKLVVSAVNSNHYKLVTDTNVIVSTGSSMLLAICYFIERLLAATHQRNITIYDINHGYYNRKHLCSPTVMTSTQVINKCDLVQLQQQLSNKGITLTFESNDYADTVIIYVSLAEKG